MYEINLDIAGVKYKSKSDSIEQGLEMLGVPKTMKMGIIKVKQGKKEAQLKLNPRMLRKVSFNKITREIIQKRLNFLLTNQ